MEDEKHPDRRQLIGGLAALSLTRCTNPQSRPDDIAFLDIANLTAGFAARRFSPVDAVDACLARIDQFDAAINSFVTLDRAAAIDAARQAEREILAGRSLGPLHGVPIAIKDNIDVAGLPCTAASTAYATHLPTDDAKVVSMLRAAGAIILGKLNLHEIAYGATGAISAADPVRNPWNPARITGGSSSGPAAATSAGFCFAAIGTDTGGSIRIPAAMCGVYGLKPTYERISRDGVMPLSPSYDHIGPICRSADDIATVFSIMAGEPPNPAPIDLKGLTVAALDTPLDYCDGVFPVEVAAAFEAALRDLQTFVSATIRARIPVPRYDRLIEGEAFRFHAETIRTMRDRFAPQTMASLLDGADVSDSELFAARAALSDARAKAASLFKGFDLAVIPTVLRSPPTIAEATDPFALTDACTFVFNQLGLPALTAPCGLFGDGMPMGLTIAGPPGAERTILALASAYDGSTRWRRRPPI